MEYLFSFLKSLPTIFLFGYTYYTLTKPFNHRVILFTWILFIMYMPLDNLLWFLLSEHVYLAFTIILKIVIAFTATDTKGRLLNLVIRSFEPTILLGILRSKAINFLYFLYLEGTQWFLELLEPKEALIFRENIINILNNNLPQPRQSKSPIIQVHQLLEEKTRNNIHKIQLIEEVQSRVHKINVFQTSGANQLQILRSKNTSIERKQQKRVYQRYHPKSGQSSERINLTQNSERIAQNLKPYSKSIGKSKFQTKPIKIHYEAETQNPAWIGVMLQMGTKSYPRLEKYFLQIQQNQLSIISTHGRIFQKHELLKIKPLPNEFYELVFQPTGLITSRIVKFTGDYEKLTKFIRH